MQRRTGWIGASGLLALFVLLAVHSTLDLGPTFDETSHLPAGYSYWVTGDFRLNPEHPPLVKRIAALPLLGMDLAFSTAWNEWARGYQLGFGRRFLYVENVNHDVLFWGRLPMIALGGLLGLLIFAWGSELGGPVAGLLALAFYALTPEFLAHSRLVTTDVPVAAFGFGAYFLLWRSLERRSAAGCAASAAFLGLALASKFSAVFLIPALLACAILHRLAPPAATATADTPRWRPGARALALSAFALLPLFVIWGSYGFEPHQPRDASGRPVYAGNFLETAPDAGLGVVTAAQAAARLSLLPEPFVYGFLAVWKTLEGRRAFLDGSISSTGWWYYFPLALLYKMPIPSLLAFATGLLMLPPRLRERCWTHAALVLPVLLYLAFSMTSAVDIGHRHLLPIYPFLYVLAGDALARGLRVRPRLAGTFVAMLLGWQAWGTLRVHPHYLTYFNEVAGGPQGGWRHLLDSNLDWGQGLPALRAWLDRHGDARIHLSYFGSDMPERYGIDYEPLPSFLPLTRPWNGHMELERGDLLVISATNLYPIFLREPRFVSFVSLLEQVRSTWQPLHVAANSIFIYEVP